MNIFVVSLVNIFVVSLVVLVHYECLFHLTRLLPKLRVKDRFRIVFGFAGTLVAHVIEIWVFAFAYYLMAQRFGWGSFSGNFEGGMLDYAYFSFTTYTTLGFGDIQPIGDVRFLTGIESLTGLLLITWSASYLFIEMQNSWNSDEIIKD